MKKFTSILLGGKFIDKLRVRCCIGLQEITNWKNRKRLTNTDPTIISSNCLGGMLYHYLGLKFNSPFVNLFLSNADFIHAMRNFDEFIQHPIVEDVNSKKRWPVGIGLDGIRVEFMHYKTFSDAIDKWNIRKERINRSNLCIIMGSWRGEERILADFESLPFMHKIVFVDKPFPQYKSAYWIKGWKADNKMLIWSPSSYITSKRYIDQFDYTDFLNNIIQEYELR